MKPNCRPSSRRSRRSKPGLPQPADRERLERVPGIEDPQDRALEIGPRVLGRVGELVDELAVAGLADPAAAEIVARALPAVPRRRAPRR